MMVPADATAVIKDPLENRTTNSKAPSRARFARAGAFAVHVFTASGAALAFLALIAAAARQWPLMLLCLGIALIVDAIDGTLARRLRVAERLPRWSGDTLDLVVDFVTYVFVPAYAICASGLLAGAAVPAGVLIVVTGVIYFADRQMKTADNYFRGFPALWNLAAFYLLLLKPDAVTGAGAIVALAALTFVPFPFVHPIRVARLRALNIALIAVWSTLALIALAQDLAPQPWVTVVLGAIGVYFLVVGLLRRQPSLE
jgi:phosphatidylcholine synthase